MSRIDSPTIAACCQQDENLKQQPGDPQRKDLVVLMCAVCHRRHYELTIDPVDVGMVLKGF